MRSLRRHSVLDESVSSATTPTTDRATRRSRRRFTRRQWRRRWRVLRVLVGVVALGALVAGAVYAVWFSRWLAVETIDVSGAQTIEAAEVRARSGIEDGEPLVRIDVDYAERRIGSLASVRKVDVTRQWPNGVLIDIEERVPVAVVDLGETLRALDRDGVVFRSYKRAPPGLPRVETSLDPTLGSSSEALREGAAVIAVLPEELTLKVDFVKVETVDEISLVLKDGREVVWGSASESDTKADVLAVLLATVQAQTYDVSVPSKPTTR